MLSILAPYRRFLRLLSKRGVLTLFCIIPVMKIISVTVWFSCFNCPSMILCVLFLKTKPLSRLLEIRMSAVLVECFRTCLQFRSLRVLLEKNSVHAYVFAFKYTYLLLNRPNRRSAPMFNLGWSALGLKKMTRRYFPSRYHGRWIIALLPWNFERKTVHAIHFLKA